MVENYEGQHPFLRQSFAPGHLERYIIQSRVVGVPHFFPQSRDVIKVEHVPILDHHGSESGDQNMPSMNNQGICYYFVVRCFH